MSKITNDDLTRSGMDAL